ncbi:MAG: hypothetical protein N4J56_006875 [Chroococcidiopsis sp. SAG 2025]|uniref:DUF4159 domain-containing protein n=1 Tax=Chroococcidiopsis sp. SAG 2025 TaxID=171389 RepID=UPI002936E247|nr:DUF4159 domain-containing protein [Chroococcidiopsis sp. SAG 2025]MDV2997170.1 hypothetical protein [Chroococcidiopsis sp. SAG 2025]
MTRPFPAPPINPFERLQVADGLLINAERWRHAHSYHRQRQNVHYQSLNQPGIVCGLGVRAIAAPKEVAAEYRDRSWLQIQPGIAIDLAGNPIVLSKPFNFRITTELQDSEPVMVYVVARYRDPDELEAQKQREIVQEMFRIDEKSTSPDIWDVELCRIRLQIDKKAITQPADVFFPGYGDIDLRYRTQVQARPQALLRVAQVNFDDSESSQNFFNLSYLLQAVEALYPSLRGGEIIDRVDWKTDLQIYDLLYLTGKQKLSLNASEFKALERYLQSGGILLVDVPSEATELIESVQSLAAQELKTPLKSLEQLRRDHPLRTRPFLFAALPLVDRQTIQLLCGGGLILAIGNLGSAWGLDEGLSLSRVTIRTAQELGVNILHYAWKRRQLMNLQKEDYSGQW